MFGQGRTLVIIMLFLAGVINYLDRSALSVAAPFIQKDYGLTTGEMGMIFSSFFVGYAAFNFIGGWAADRYGAKTTLLLAMVLWSLFSGLTVLTVGFMSLVFIRILFGMGEGPLSVTTSKMVNNWYTPKQRARALGSSMSGTPLGGGDFRTGSGLYRHQLRLEGVVHHHHADWPGVGGGLVQIRQGQAHRQGCRRDCARRRPERDGGAAGAPAALLPQAADRAVHLAGVLFVQLHAVLLPDLVP